MDCVLVWTQLKCSEAVRAPQNGDPWQAVVNAVMFLDKLSNY